MFQELKCLARAGNGASISLLTKERDEGEVVVSPHQLLAQFLHHMGLFTPDVFPAN